MPTPFLPLPLVGAGAWAALLSGRILAAQDLSPNVLMIAGIVTLTLLAIFLRKKLG